MDIEDFEDFEDILDFVLWKVDEIYSGISET